MSDFSIPGTGSSKYNTKDIIQSTMELERIPLQRMTAELERAKLQKGVWQDVNTGLQQLLESATALYGFQNPFQERTATTGNDRVLTATATREAGEESRELVVGRLASADRILSRPIDRGSRVESGRYTFAVGDREVSFSFAGGTITEFVDAVNRRAGELVKASLLRDTQNSSVLLIEGRMTGADNMLEFRDQARDFAVSAGLIVPSDSKSLTVDIREGSVQASSASTAPTGTGRLVTVESGELTVLAGGKARIAVSPPFGLDANMVLELEVRTVSHDQKAWTPPPPPPGPELPQGDSVTYGGITIRNAPSRMPLPEYNAPKPPVVTEDMRILSVENGSRSIPLPETDLTSQYRRMRIPIGTLTDSISGLVVENRNTYRDISIRSAHIYDSTSRGDARPLNALSEAANAELTVDGIPVTRPSNTIDDLIPGVTLTLRSESPDPVTLTIAPNLPLIKDKIVAFVGRYNQILTEIDVVTRRDESIVADAYYETKEERTAAEERLGVLAGDMTLSRLKSSLSTSVMNAYRTSAGPDLTLLAQLGISTSTAAPGSATLDMSRLRGYLDIDETRLENTLRDQPKASRELFGSDTDGDLVVDSGVAYEVDRYLRAFVGRAGIIAQRLSTVDTEITSRNRQIDRENDKLEDTEAELRRKYTAMEGALRTLEDSSRRLDAFNQQND